MPAQPPRWGRERLEADRQTAIQEFREERIGESLHAYRANFAHYRAAIERLLESTEDLSGLADEAYGGDPGPSSPFSSSRSLSS